MTYADILLAHVQDVGVIKINLLYLEQFIQHLVRTI